MVDAEQAYIQAEMKGDPTWICLPPEARPEWWKKKFPNLSVLSGLSEYNFILRIFVVCSVLDSAQNKFKTFMHI